MVHHKKVDRGEVAQVLQTAAWEALHASARWHRLLMAPGPGFDPNLPTEGRMLAVVSVPALRSLRALMPDASAREISTLVWHLMELVEEVHLGWLNHVTVEKLCGLGGSADWGDGVVRWLRRAGDRCLQNMADELAESGLILVGGVSGAAREAA